MMPELEEKMPYEETVIFDEKLFQKGLEKLRNPKPKTILSRTGFKIWKRIEEGTLQLPDWILNDPHAHFHHPNFSTVAEMKAYFQANKEAAAAAAAAAATSTVASSSNATSVATSSV